MKSVDGLDLGGQRAADARDARDGEGALVARAHDARGRPTRRRRSRPPSRTARTRACLPRHRPAKGRARHVQARRAVRAVAVRRHLPRRPSSVAVVVVVLAHALRFSFSGPLARPCPWCRARRDRWRCSRRHPGRCARGSPAPSWRWARTSTRAACSCCARRRHRRRRPPAARPTRGAAAAAPRCRGRGRPPPPPGQVVGAHRVAGGLGRVPTRCRCSSMDAECIGLTLFCTTSDTPCTHLSDWARFFILASPVEMLCVAPVRVLGVALLLVPVVAP